MPVSNVNQSTDLAALAKKVGKRQSLPPVDRWDPPLCGAIDIRIASDGRWFHEGREIRRLPLVRLFASVLRKDSDGETYLVTPYEKLSITVDDVPLLAVDYDPDPSDPTLIRVRTNMDDEVVIGADHAVRFVEDTDNAGLRVYARIRGRLDAVFTRAMTIALLSDDRFVDLDANPPVLRSGNCVFAIEPDDGHD